jgi:hypothetical protein
VAGCCDYVMEVWVSIQASVSCYRVLAVRFTGNKLLYVINSNSMIESSALTKPSFCTSC